jgi:hypothetical protein
MYYLKVGGVKGLPFAANLRAYVSSLVDLCNPHILTETEYNNVKTRPKCGEKCEYKKYACKKHIGTRFVHTLADCYHCVKKQK